MLDHVDAQAGGRGFKEEIFDVSGAVKACSKSRLPRPGMLSR
ncbi:MAG: hypothetical protein QXQ03_04555 [Candidatus Nezhaarchaeales archaeon]